MRTHSLVPATRTASAFALASLLWCVVSGAATYRWVDKDGVVHYSDRPAAGATEVQLPKSAAPAVPPPRSTASPPGSSSQAANNFRYASCAITTPLQDQTFANTSSVSASLNLQPALRQGDRIEVLLDSAVLSGWPPTSTSYFLSNLFRGSHDLAVIVRDSTGLEICNAPVVRFHVTQPSLLAPARR